MSVGVDPRVHPYSGLEAPPKSAIDHRIVETNGMPLVFSFSGHILLLTVPRGKPVSTRG